MKKRPLFYRYTPHPTNGQVAWQVFAADGALVCDCYSEGTASEVVMAMNAGHTDVITLNDAHVAPGLDERDYRGELP